MDKGGCVGESKGNGVGVGKGKGIDASISKDAAVGVV